MLRATVRVSSIRINKEAIKHASVEKFKDDMVRLHLAFLSAIESPIWQTSTGAKSDIVSTGELKNSQGFDFTDNDLSCIFYNTALYASIVYFGVNYANTRIPAKPWMKFVLLSYPLVHFKKLSSFSPSAIKG